MFLLFQNILHNIVRKGSDYQSLSRHQGRKGKARHLIVISIYTDTSIDTFYPPGSVADPRGVGATGAPLKLDQLCLFFIIFFNYNA